MTATERSMTLKSALRCLGIKAVREFGELLRVSSSDTGPASFCGQGYYCAPGGSMEPCAVHQTSPAGATSCSCETGYELQAATGTSVNVMQIINVTAPFFYALDGSSALLLRAVSNAVTPPDCAQSRLVRTSRHLGEPRHFHDTWPVGPSYAVIICNALL